ncbi:MAG TPA: lipid-binding protein [Chitinophagaceae bacterium]|nr:lipid-binding protein [Chitinophagaceae bacterium]
MNRRLYSLATVLLGGILLLSCSKDPEVENTPTVNMAGEWWTTFYEGGDALTDMHKTLTYNTADPSGAQIWVDTHEHSIKFKTKLDVDYGTLSFRPNSTGVDLLHPTITIKVLEGKVLPRAGRSKSGVEVDSLYMRFEFSDEPGVPYELRGHQRTGFFEDEYE